jgi:hypothetical protein
MKYFPKHDGRRKRANAQHLAACEAARTTGAAYTWLWCDGGITHMVSEAV